MSFDAAVHLVCIYGKGALLAETDIEFTFRLLPIHPGSGGVAGKGPWRYKIGRQSKSLKVVL